MTRKSARFAALLTACLLACAAPTRGQAPAALTLADMEGDFSQFRGVAKDTKLARAGAASARWGEHVRSTSAHFAGVPTDWSGFDNLEFWLHSAKANAAEFMLIIRSENDQTDGMDYWSQKFTADWAGWRKVRIPIKSLGRGARKPRGWDQIDYFYFTCRGWSCEPKPDTVIHIDDVRLTNDPCRVSVLGYAAKPGGRVTRVDCRVRVTNRVDRGLDLTPAADAPDGVEVEFTPARLRVPVAGSREIAATIVCDGDRLSTPAALAEQQVELTFSTKSFEHGDAIGVSLPVSQIYFASLPVPPHPRVLMNADTLADLRRRATQEARAKEMAARILRSADGLIKRYAPGVPKDELARWNAVLAPYWDEWVEEMGPDGQTVVDVFQKHWK